MHSLEAVKKCVAGMRKWGVIISPALRALPEPFQSESRTLPGSLVGVKHCDPPFEFSPPNVSNPSKHPALGFDTHS